MQSETNLIEFIQKLPDELSYIKFLEVARFPDGEIKSPFGERGASRVSAARPGFRSSSGCLQVP